MTQLENARMTINEVDKKMAELFVERMKAARIVADYKIQKGLKVKDEEREKNLIESNLKYISDSEIAPYYIQFIKSCIDISCNYQEKLMEQE